MENSSNLCAIINYWTELYLQSYQASTMKLFYKNSQWPKGVDYFCEKAPSQMFGRIPNVHPIGEMLEISGAGKLQVHGIFSHRLVCREAVET